MSTRSLLWTLHLAVGCALAQEPAPAPPEPDLSRAMRAASRASSPFWREEGQAIRRISARFVLHGMTYVTPAQAFAKAVKKACPTLHVSDEDTKEEFSLETEIDIQAPGWKSVIRRNGEIVDHFYTFAFPARAPGQVALAACQRLGHLVPPAMTIVRLPVGQWRGEILFQRPDGSAVLFPGDVSLSSQALTLRDQDPDVAPIIIPIAAIRDVAMFGEKRELPLPGRETWESVAWQDPLFSLPGLAAYSLFQPLFSQFMPTRRTLEFIYLEEGSPRIVAVRLERSAYERFAAATTATSKAVGKVAAIFLGHPP